MKKSEVRNLSRNQEVIYLAMKVKVDAIFRNGAVAIVVANDGKNFAAKNKELSFIDGGESDPHAELRAQYEKDAKWHPRPWELWEFKWKHESDFSGCYKSPSWYDFIEYRRKPLIINGVELKDEPVREALEVGTAYYIPAVGSLLFRMEKLWEGSELDIRHLSRGLIYLDPEPASTHGRALASFTEVPK